MLLVLAWVLVFSGSLWFQTGTVSADPAQESEKEVSIDARNMFGSYARQGAWLPIQVDIVNKGPDIQGKLVVIYGNNDQYLTDYITRVVVPTGATKRYSLTVPVNEYTGSLKVELVTDKGKKIADDRVNLTFQSIEQPIIGLLDRAPAEFPGLIGLRGFNGISPTLLTLEQADFPDQPELLEFFDILVIDDVDLQINKEQAGALTYWVNRGGTLVIGGGPGWRKIMPNLPSELRPAEVSEVKNRNLNSLRKVFKGDGKPPAGPVAVADITQYNGKPVYAENGQPLVIETTLGGGRVIFLAFDPALEPMSSWSGTRIILQELLFKDSGLSAGKGNPVAQKFISGRNPWAQMEALNTIPALKMPSLMGMAVILAVYLLLVGLINYLVLKKLDKREWTWFTAPTMAVVFVAVIYVTSFQERYSGVLTHQISIVNTSPGSTLARVSTTTGVFAPQSNTYEMRLEGRHLVNGLPTFDERGMRNPGQRPAAKIVVDQEPGATRIELRDMKAWVMRGFSTAGVTPLKGTVTGELVLKDKKWVGVVTNNTEYDFTDGLMLSPFGYKKTGELKAGGKINVELPALTSGQFNMGVPFYYQAYNPGWNWRGPGRPPQPDQKDFLRQQILESMFNGEWGPDGVGQLMFLGWSDKQAEGALTIPGQDIRRYYTTLFKASLELKFDKDNLQVPPGIIVGTVVDSQNAGFGPPGIIHMQPNSEAVYQFELPEGKFTEMKLHISASTGYRSWEGQLYNWEKQEWENFKATGGTNTVQDHRKYVNGNRLVRFRLTSDRDGFEVSGVSISLENKGGERS